MAALQHNLFASGEPALDVDAPFERVELDDSAWVDVCRGWLRGADELAVTFIDQIDWRQGRRWMYERHVDDPRLSRGYSSSEQLPHPILTTIDHALQRRYRKPMRGPALNYYRYGHDSVAPHRDRELRHLDDTLIAIVTLGARRPFLIAPHGGGTSVDIAPASGDLLVMGGTCGRDWVHGVPKVAHAGPRISVTWRWTSRRGRPEMGADWGTPRNYGDRRGRYR